MKHRAGNWIAVLLALVLGLLSLAGCNRDAGKTDADTLVATCEGEKIYLDEMKLYVYASQYDVEKDSEMMIGALYGDYQSFWEEEGEGDSYWHFNCETAMSKMYQTKMLCKAAEKAGVALTDEDRAKVETAIENYKTEMEAVVTVSAATDDLIRKYITENALANKYYLDIISGIDQNYDEAEMKRSNVEGLTVVVKSEYTPKVTDEDGNTTDGETVTYTDEEQNENRQKVTEEIFEKIKNGGNVDDVVEEYQDSEIVTVYSLGTLEISLEDKPENEAELESYRNLAWTMKTGDVESGIYNNSNNTPIGYVLRCVNDDDPELRDEAIKTEKQQRENTLFVEKNESLVKKYSSFHVNTDYLDAISFTGALFESETVSAVPATGE